MLALVLVFALAFLPTAGSVALAAGQQQQSQQNTQKQNDSGNMLSKLVGVLSIAAGAMSIASGVKDLSAGAASSCMAPGTSALETATNQGLVSKGVQDATATQLQVPVVMRLQWKTLEGIKAVLRWMSSDELAEVSRYSTKLSMVFTRKSHANACVQGAMSVAMGGMMVLMGLMGLQGAKKAGQNAVAAGANSVGMSSLNTKLDGTTGGNNAGIKIDPSLLRKGASSTLMKKFEDKFGIDRDQFADAVGNRGEDPRPILAAAPKNPISPADMNKALTAAQNMSAEEKAAVAAAMGTDKAAGEQYAYNTSGGSSMGGTKSSSSDLAPLEPLAPLPGAEVAALAPVGADLALSPEVQAALAQEALANRTNGLANESIFQMVHNKYKEKYHMIYGSNAGQGTSLLNGIADANGN